MGKVIQFPRPKLLCTGKPKGALADYQMVLSRELADIVMPPVTRDIAKTLRRIYPGIF
jgi:hypothetical protein